MLPQPLVEQFWDKVQGILCQDHRLDEEASRKAVSSYRRLVEPKVGEMLYHEDARTVAETISRAVKDPGFLATAQSSQ